MKVLVLGAGVVGSTLAYYLAEDGHQVEVLERQPAAGMETSFANGGQISVSHATPWASPRTLWKALEWIGREDAPLLFRWFRYDPALWRWGLRFLANCTATASQKNTEQTVRLAMYSRDCLRDLRQRLDLRYDALTKGILHIFRNQQEFETQIRFAEVMRQVGLPQTVLTPEEMVQQEPALQARSQDLVGGLYSADDESGDAHKFTQAIAAAAAQHGAVFCYGRSVIRLDVGAGRVQAVYSDGDQGVLRHTADAYVVCLASWSPALVRPLSLPLVIYPAKGYSLTLPLAEGERQAPTISITDDQYKMVYSRFGNRLRAAGTAELAGWDGALRPERARQLKAWAQSLFPLAGDYDRAEMWCGLRPKTPDSLPYLGKTPYENLYLNTGHGTLGWTMAAGSGRLVADLLSGRRPDIDILPFGIR